jgi:hypothetical protein
MRSLRSRTSFALLVSLAASLSAAPGAIAVESPESFAGFARDPSPGTGSICLHEREVFRPKAVASTDGAGPGRRIELVRETVCDDLRRSSCFEAGLCR